MLQGVLRKAFGTSQHRRPFGLTKAIELTLAAGVDPDLVRHMTSEQTAVLRIRTDAAREIFLPPDGLAAELFLVESVEELPYNVVVRHRADLQAGETRLPILFDLNRGRHPELL